MFNKCCYFIKFYLKYCLLFLAGFKLKAYMTYELLEKVSTFYQPLPNTDTLCLLNNNKRPSKYLVLGPNLVYEKISRLSSQDVHHLDTV